MKKILLLILAIIAMWPLVQAQNVGINDDGSDPDAAAMLDIKSTNKGILIPRIDYNSKPASPPVGLLIFVTANGPEGNNAFYFYNGTVWAKVAGGSDSDWTVSGDDMYSAVSGNVGIGTNTPSVALEISSKGTSSADRILFDIEDDQNTGQLLFMGHTGGTNHIQVTTNDRDSRLTLLAGDLADGAPRLIFVGAEDTDGVTIRGSGFFDYGSDATPLPSAYFNIRFHDGTFYQDVIKTIGSTDIILNESGNDTDIRMESDGDANSFFIEGSSGNVGIGTSSVAGSKLNVEGRIRANNGASDTNDDNSGDYLGSSGYWKMRTGANFRLGFDTYNTSNAWQESLSILRDGNVGIGTSTPSALLDVDGTLRFRNGASDGYILTSDATGNATWSAPSAASTDSDWTVSGDDMYSAVSGSVGIGVIPEAWDASRSVIQLGGVGVLHAVTSPAIVNPLSLMINAYYDGTWKRIVTGKSSYINVGPGYQAFGRAVSDDADTDITFLESVRMDEDGKVGIGTSTPSALLDVDGTLRFRNGASDGYILTSDATGNATWSPPSAGDPSPSGWTVSGEDVYNSGSGNVGIGTTTPTSYHPFADNLVVSAIADAGITVATGTANVGSLLFADGTTSTEMYDGYIQYDHNTRKLDLGSGALDRLTIDGATGNVGIGTTSPTTKFDVKGGVIAEHGVASLIEGDIDTNTSPWGATLLLQGSTNTGTASLASGRAKAAKIEGITDVGGALGHMGLYTRTSAGEISEKVRIDNNGNVGIGTTTPQDKFHLSYDGATISSSLLSPNEAIISINENATGVNQIVSSDADKRSVFKGTRTRGTTNSPTAAASGDGVVSLLGNYYDGTSTGGTAEIAFVVDGDVSAGVRPQRIEFKTSETTGRSTRMTIKGNGNVGIGTTTPTYNFDVTGDINYTGTLYQDGSPLSVTGLWSTGTGNINYTGGKVGIGTTTADHLFEVEGDAGTAPSIVSTYTSGASTYMYSAAADGYVGTLGSHNLTLSTNSTGRMTITSDGEIGIGTTEPTAMIEVETTGSAASLFMNRTDGALAGLSGGSNAGFLGTRTEHPLEIYTGASMSTKMYIGDDAEKGYVGIGTTNPTELLHLEKAVGNARVLVNNTATAGTNAPGFEFENEGTWEGGLFYVEEDDAVELYSAFSGNNPAIAIAGSSNNVGIGTDSPSSHLFLEYDEDNTSDWYTNGTAGMIIHNTNANGDGVMKLSGLSSKGRIVYGTGIDSDRLILSSRQSGGSTTEIVAIDNNGKLGIGTTSPGSLLTVSTAATGGAIALERTGVSPSLMTITNTANTIVTDYNGPLGYKWRTSGTDRMTLIASSGNLGIGTTAPATKLDVEGTVSYAIGSIAASTDAFDVSGATIFGVNTADGNIVIGGLSGGAQGQTVHFYKSTSLNSLTVEHNEATGTQKIICPGGTDLTFNSYGGLTLVFNGSNWFVVGVAQ